MGLKFGNQDSFSGDLSPEQCDQAVISPRAQHGISGRPADVRLGVCAGGKGLASKPGCVLSHNELYVHGSAALWAFSLEMWWGLPCGALREVGSSPCGFPKGSRAVGVS